VTTERRRYQRWPNYAQKYRNWTADAAQQMQEIAAQARKANTEVLRLRQLDYPTREKLGHELDVALADIGRLAALIELWMLQAAQGEPEDV
jgi:hypothetical protein